MDPEEQDNQETDPQPETGEPAAPGEKGDVGTIVDQAEIDLDVEAIDKEPIADESEPEPQPESEPEPQPEPESREGEKTLKLLEGEFPDLDELNFDGFYENLEARHLEKMDPYSRRILHNLRIEFIKAKKELETREAEREREHAKRLKDIEERERQIVLEREQLNAWVTDPRIQKMLEPDNPDDPEPDPMTPEGQTELIRRLVKAQFAETVKPANDAYADISREKRYLDFKAQHPKEMNDQAFLKEMAGVIKQKNEGGQQVSLEDAFDLTRARRLVRDSEKRRAKELAVRQRAQEKISRTTKGGIAQEKGVPLEVRKKGARAIAQYLRDHPKVAEEVRAEQRGL